jgi:hypothetical protein
LFDIVSGIGTPLAIDDATLSRLFGLYARVLVDVDMSSRLFDYVIMEREDHAFLIAIEYEKQPLYWAHCKMLGHTLQNCRKLYSKNGHTDKPKVAKKKQLNTMQTDSIVVGGKGTEVLRDKLEGGCSYHYYVIGQTASARSIEVVVKRVLFR